MKSRSWARSLDGLDGLDGAGGPNLPAPGSAADLQRLAEFQRQLMAVVCHDVRSPLSAISIAGHLLAASPARGPREERALRSLQGCVKRINGVLELLVQYATAAEASAFAPEPARLHPLCDQVVAELEASSGQDRLVTRLEAEDGGCWDERRLGQALSNLLGNALEYGAPNRPVTLSTRGGAHQPLTVEVHNFGPPIPPELLPVLFEPYRRANGGRPKGRHLGLGLYIAREAVRAHGGELRVRSTRALGTSFTFTLPRRPPGA